MDKADIHGYHERDRHGYWSEHKLKGSHTGLELWDLFFPLAVILRFDDRRQVHLYFQDALDGHRQTFAFVVFDVELDNEIDVRVRAAGLARYLSSMG